MTRLVLLVALLLAPPAMAADDLEQQFLVLRDSLRAMGGLLDLDRPAVERFRARSRAAADTGDEVAMAIDLQVMLWLDRDPARLEDDAEKADAEAFRVEIAARFDQLLAVRSDAALARAALDFKKDAGLLSGDALAAAEAALVQQYPGAVEIVGPWCRRLRDEGRFDEIIRLLADRTDLVEEPALAVVLGQAYFAENRFDEARALAQSIEVIPLNPTDMQIRSELQTLRADCGLYADLWAAELAIREQEASAGDLPRVEIVTAKGSITVELFENEAPNTVANFITLTESGFYPGTSFHRFDPYSVVQGGDVNSKDGVEGLAGTGNPGYTIPDEHTLPNFRNHFGDSIGMAKTNAADSAGSQFYFNHKPNASFNGRYTVFGRVVDGMDVMRSLRIDDEIVSVRVVRKRDQSYEPITIPLPEVAPDATDDADAPATPPDTGAVSPPGDSSDGG